MAILCGPFASGFRKRVGQTVGQYIGKGRYRISQYVDTVKNPRTVPQQVQRSKFSFLGKLAVILGNDAIVGFSNTKYRTAQLAFISANMPNVLMDVIGDPTQVNPTLTLRGVELSAGGVITPDLSLVSVDANTFEVTVSTRYGIESNRPTSVVLVAVCLSEVSRAGYRAAVMTADYNKFKDGVAYVDQFKMQVDTGSGEPPAGGFPVVVYAYNAQLPMKNYRTHYGDVQAFTVHDEQAFGAVDAMKTASGRVIYSKTVHRIINIK